MATQLIHFVADGFTHDTRVYLRGEMLEVDTDKWPHYKWSPDEQLKRLGYVYWNSGAWPGALHDLEDPELAPEDREKLAQVNAQILAAREKGAPQKGDDTSTEPKRRRAPAAA